MNHLVRVEKVLKKYFKMYNKIQILIKKELKREPMYNDKYIKIKIKIYNNKIYTNLQIMNTVHVYL